MRRTGAYLRYSAVILAALFTALAIPAHAKTRYLPAAEEIYEMQADGTWMLQETVTYTHNKKGYLTAEESRSKELQGYDEETGEEIWKDHVSVSKYKYNKSGMITKQTTYEDGEETWRLQTVYDKNLSIKSETYYENKKLSERFVYKLDRKGTILKETYYKGKKKTAVITYKYDKKGNLLKQTKKDPKGKLVSVTEYKYKYKGKKLIQETEKFNDYENIDGDHTSVATYYSNGNMKKYESKGYGYYQIDLYNKKGIQTKGTYSSAVDDYKSVTSYDDDGRIISDTVDSNGTRSYISYEYTLSNKRIKSMIMYVDKEPARKTMYTYVRIKG